MEATNQSLSTKHLLGIQYLTPEDIEIILHNASYFKEVINRPIRKVPSLRDKTIANIFFENSTRTRISFELAQKRLGADVVNFSASSSSLKKGETLLDTVNNILAMKVDMVVMRHSAIGAVNFISERTPAAIVNAGDGTREHPTQALLDAFSMQQEIGELAGKNIAILGDIKHSRVALSNILLLKKMGANVKICGPKTLIPHQIGLLGVEVCHDINDILGWADVINVLRIQLERQSIVYFPSLQEYHAQFGLRIEHVKNLSHQPVILHPGPINRGVEISSDLADSEHAVILDQVENGVAVRMAVMYLLGQ